MPHPRERGPAEMFLPSTVLTVSGSKGLRGILDFGMWISNLSATVAFNSQSAIRNPQFFQDSQPQPLQIGLPRKL